MRTSVICALAAALCCAAGTLVAPAHAGVVIAVGAPGVVVAPPAAVYARPVVYARPAIPGVAVGLYPRLYHPGYYPRYFGPGYVRVGFGWGYGYRGGYCCRGRPWR